MAGGAVTPREIKCHKDAQRTLNGELMEFLEPFTTRSNLGTILKKGTDKLQRDYVSVKVCCCWNWSHLVM